MAQLEKFNAWEVREFVQETQAEKKEIVVKNRLKFRERYAQEIEPVLVRRAKQSAVEENPEGLILSLEELGIEDQELEFFVEILEENGFSTKVSMAGVDDAEGSRTEEVIRISWKEEEPATENLRYSC